MYQSQASNGADQEKITRAMLSMDAIVTHSGAPQIKEAGMPRAKTLKGSHPPSKEARVPHVEVPNNRPSKKKNTIVGSCQGVKRCQEKFQELKNIPVAKERRLRVLPMLSTQGGRMIIARCSSI